MPTCREVPEGSGVGGVNCPAQRPHLLAPSNCS
jgi:hypothetical protein